jgi:TPP-dependent pyruvate/acetoin dehydrogenase alpha subunit
MSVATVPEVVKLEHLLLQMLRIRSFEGRVLELFAEGLVRGSAHPYIGQEAIAVGVCDALEPTDYITSTHRGHGHCIAKGLELRPMMSEITGRSNGYCRGKGGSMHITALAHGMLGADAIVAGSLAIAVGAAYGLRLQGHEAVTVAFFGDGASNQGIFHEAANLAAVLKAPVVFVCENNRWAISTPVEQSTAVPDIAARAAGYGFPGEVVDGNDVLAVREAAERAVARARSGNGPTLIEAKTFRITPHSAATPQDDRDPEVLDAWRRRDPIDRLRALLSDTHGVERGRLEELAAQAAHEVADAVDHALASPHPDPSEAYDDVYAPSPWQTPGRLA